MKDTFYFSHDYNVRTDDKIKKVFRKLGLEGYGLFWCIIEDLYNNANALQLDYDGLAFDYRTTPETIKILIEDFDLFILDGEIFYSKSVQDRLEKRDDKSAKARENANKRWNKDNATAMQPHNDSNAIKESKVKESKGNKIKINNNSKELTKTEVFGSEEINNMQNFIKEKVESLGYIYKSGKNERNRIKNILTAKQINGLAEKYNMNIYDFVGNIILLSGRLDFWNGQITNAETFYKHYDRILNESVKLKQKKESAMVDYGSL